MRAGTCVGSQCYQHGWDIESRGGAAILLFQAPAESIFESQERPGGKEMKESQPGTWAVESRMPLRRPSPGWRAKQDLLQERCSQDAVKAAETAGASVQWYSGCPNTSAATGGHSSTKHASKALVFWEQGSASFPFFFVIVGLCVRVLYPHACLYTTHM